MSMKRTTHMAGLAIAMVATACLWTPAMAGESITTGDGLLSMTAELPDQIRMGEEFQYDVKVSNTSDNVTIHDIELKQLKAKGFSVSSTSSPSKKGNKNGKKNSDQQKSQQSDGMMISILKPGESKTINVKATADKEGQLRSCLAIVNYMPAICLTSKVVKPQLELTKMAPKKVNRCEVIELEYTVKNGGTGDVGPFVVTDSLGKGLATIEGNDKLEFDVDGLSAGDSRKFVARVYASETGEFSSRASAEAENSELNSRSEETTTKVIAADLNVTLDGPSRLYGGQIATFTGNVTNTGNFVAKDVTVDVSWPQASKMMGIGDASMKSSGQSGSNSKSGNQQQPTMANKNKKSDKSGNKNNKVDMSMSDESFTIASLQPGQTATFQYDVRPGDVQTLPTKVVATYVCTIDAVGDEAAAKSEATAMAMARAEVVRLPALQMVVLDDEDPVAQKSDVVYSIRVWNEGDADDNNVTLTAEIPDGLEFVSASGPSEHSQDGSTVSFDAIKTMQPGDRADYKVIAKSVGDGDVRFTAKLNSDSLEKDVIGEEPTRLFDEQAK